MNELIKVQTNEKMEPVISGRELHAFLQVGSEYMHWFERMKEYGFTDGLDFSSILAESSGGRPATDHIMKLDMAKEISMIQRNEMGKKAREYFIEVEKQYNSPDAILARAHKIMEQRIKDLQWWNTALELKTKELETKIDQSRPKVLFADAVDTSDTSILVGDLAKILKQNGFDVGQNRLFAILREKGFLIKGGSSKNLPTQRSIEAGLFQIKESSVVQPDGAVRITKTPKVTGKGQIFFVNLFLGKPPYVHTHIADPQYIGPVTA